MRRVAAALALLWCLANLVVAYWMIQGAFVAKTAMHEGFAAQVSLLLGGLLIAGFTLLLVRVCLRIIAVPDEVSGA